MRKPLSSVLAIALLAVAAAPPDAFAQPNVRDHRNTPTTNAGPTAPPPAPEREYRPAPRRGQVWVDGEWDWRGGKWVWQVGRFEQRKRGKQWNAGRWEQRDGRWERVRGDWRDAPTQQPAPPEPYPEQPQARRGHIWVKGHWEWNNGAYDWVAGRFERRQRGKSWKDGQWANAGGTWTFNAGVWVDAPREQPAPPPPIPEATQQRRGMLWVPGHWELAADGSYDWVAGKLERRQKGKRFRRAEWVNQGGKWTFTPGGWDAPKDQDVPPPLLDEKWTERPGYVWARGYWIWDDGDYVWIPGHHERQRPGQQWINAEWGRVDSKWVFTAGRWQ